MHFIIFFLGRNDDMYASPNGDSHSASNDNNRPNKEHAYLQFDKTQGMNIRSYKREAGNKIEKRRGARQPFSMRMS